MLNFHVSVSYTLVNLLIALIIFFKSHRNQVSQFYLFCVGALVAFGLAVYSLTLPLDTTFKVVLQQIVYFLFSFIPSFFLHFTVIFLKRYEILKARSVILSIYFVGLFSYAMLLLGLLPKPFFISAAVPLEGYVFYVTWMSIFFSIGVALLYSLVSGFTEHEAQSRLLVIGFASLLLLLPGPFTESMITLVFQRRLEWYFLSSTLALAIAVYLVFRHKVIMNTPYQALKSALAAMNDLLIKTDDNFKIEMVRGAISPLGYSEGELVGRSLSEFTDHDDQLREYHEDVMAGKIKESFLEAELITKDGKRLPMDFSITPLFANENLTGFVALGRNVSDRHQAEEALRESEERYRSLFENMLEGFAYCKMLFDDQGRPVDFVYVDVNSAFHELTGLKNVVGKKVSEVIPGIRESNPELFETYGRVALSGKPERFETYVQSLGLQFSISVYSPQKGYFVAVIDNITERKIAERSLLESEERYRAFFEEDLTADIITTVDGKYVAFNPAFLRMFRFASSEEALKTNASQLYSSPEKREEIIQLLRRQKQLINYEIELRRRDGTPLYGITNMIGIFDNSGELVQIKGYIFDNTDRRTLEEHLRQAQKMETVGTLAGGIAHDFNNILGIVLGHAGLLERSSFDPKRLSESTDAIKKAVQRGSGLVKQLLTFARKTDVLLESVDMNTVVEELNKMLSETFPEKIEIQLELDEHLPSIIGDHNQIYQALLNLCLNARDAMPKGGTITISTGTVRGESLYERHLEASADDYVSLIVADTGVGMDANTKSRIFEPFFTTRAGGKGTGLGLSVVYGIVKSHNGFIDVQSNVGQGTTFRLYFPVQPRRISLEEMRKKTDGELPAGTETILVVEDEELLLDMLKTLLEGNGYRVLTAQDGAEAVEIYMTKKNEIAAVITDTGLPKLDGSEVFRRLLEIKPDVKVIFSSGYVDPNLREELLKKGAKDFLQKPYTRSEILNSLRHAIEPSVAS